MLAEIDLINVIRTQNFFSFVNQYDRWSCESKQSINICINHQECIVLLQQTWMRAKWIIIGMCSKILYTPHTFHCGPWCCVSHLQPQQLLPEWLSPFSVIRLGTFASKSISSERALFVKKYIHMTLQINKNNNKTIHVHFKGHLIMHLHMDSSSNSTYEQHCWIELSCVYDQHNNSCQLLATSTIDHKCILSNNLPEQM